MSEYTVGKVYVVTGFTAGTVGVGDVVGSASVGTASVGAGRDSVGVAVSATGALVAVGEASVDAASVGDGFTAGSAVAPQAVRKMITRLRMSNFKCCFMTDTSQM